MKMMRLLRLLAAIVSLLLIACQPFAPLSSPINSPISETHAAKYQVSGYLFRVSEGSPLRKIRIFAATLSTSQDGFEIYVVDPAVTPYSSTDDEGFFYFDNLPVGKYVLVADAILSHVLLEDADGKPILFEIKDEKTSVSLGTRRVNFSLPDGV